jgi:hypothetical protein
MIRPITVICWILALGAGLYLYRAKHEVELMDKHIEQVARETNDIRAESRHFLDEWIRLGEPEQLRKYSDEYLGLKAVMPTQFVRLSDLPAHLPAPRADPVDGTVEATAQPEASPAAPGEDADEASSDELPVPPIPPAPTVLTAVTLPAVTAHAATAPADTAPADTAPSAIAPSGITPPLQARPVTLRPVVQGSTNAQPARPAPAQGPPPAQAQNLPAPDLPPLRALGPRLSLRQGLPPLQAQGLPPSPGQGAPPRNQPDVRPADVQIANGHSVDPRPDTRRAQGQVQAQARPPYQPPPYQAPSSGVSLLGTPRGAVPLPLPAPTPVTWPGSNR